MRTVWEFGSQFGQSEMLVSNKMLAFLQESPIGSAHSAQRVLHQKMSGLWASGPSRRRSVGDSTKDRRPRLKALAAESAQERRRHEFISTQKRVRAVFVSLKRYAYSCSVWGSDGVYDSKSSATKTGGVSVTQTKNLPLSTATIFACQCRPLLKRKGDSTVYSSVHHVQSTGSHIIVPLSLTNGREEEDRRILTASRAILT